LALLHLAVYIDLLGDRAVGVLRYPGAVPLSTHILASIHQAITDVGIHPKSVLFSVHIRPFEYGGEAGRVVENSGHEVAVPPSVHIRAARGVM